MLRLRKIASIAPASRKPCRREGTGLRAAAGSRSGVHSDSVMPHTATRSSLDDVIDAYKPGIDVTLIDENLRCSLDERLRRLQRLLEFAEELRRAGRELTSKQ